MPITNKGHLPNSNVKMGYISLHMTVLANIFTLMFHVLFIWVYVFLNTMLEYNQEAKTVVKPFSMTKLYQSIHSFNQLEPVRVYTCCLCFLFVFVINITYIYTKIQTKQNNELCHNIKRCLFYPLKYISLSIYMRLRSDLFFKPVIMFSVINKQFEIITWVLY